MSVFPSEDRTPQYTETVETGRDRGEECSFGAAYQRITEVLPFLAARERGSRPNRASAGKTTGLCKRFQSHFLRDI
jgi:hypothetical protein